MAEHEEDEDKRYVMTNEAYTCDACGDEVAACSVCSVEWCRHCEGGQYGCDCKEPGDA